MASRERACLLDHVSLPVRDVARAAAFYAAALAPLGFGVVMEFPGTVAFGLPGQPQLWLHRDTSAAPVHIALHAEDEAAVRSFHAAGLAAGGTDNGQPGPRSHYHPGYYAAYVKDPDGNNLEAVLHGHRVES